MFVFGHGASADEPFLPRFPARIRITSWGGNWKCRLLRWTGARIPSV